ncbi:MAG: DUF1800 family protein [Verrucomicrobia bacterium]|jgi:hypothetical protein|nr:DUF1800 family protein [Verrucomicrobiota bacterium]
MSYWRERRNLALLTLAGLLSQGVSAAERPAIESLQLEAGQLKIQVDVPDGFGHVVVESGSDLREGLSHPLISGGLFGFGGTASFSIPEPGQTLFLKIRAGLETDPPLATYMGGTYFQFEADAPGGGPLTDSQAANHALNRLAYGPTPSDAAWIDEVGLDAFIEAQLNPETIDEENNSNLNTSNRTLFHEYRPGIDTVIIEDGARWYLRKGDVAPPSNWSQLDYKITDDPGSWSLVRSGFGYTNQGDEEDYFRFELSDMRRIEEGANARPGYLSFFVRHEFEIADPSEIDGLLLKMIYDDGFVAYINGEEVARDNMRDLVRPNYRATASNSGDPDFGDFDISEFKNLLIAGNNVLAIQLHNTSYTSSDAILSPVLYRREYYPGLEYDRINDIDSLQKLIHSNGLFSKKQLQAVMGEFWENHFTTDYDKTAEYLDDLEDSLGEDAMFEPQAEQEAAHMEYLEYQFFHDHAFDSFGDLLLYSATSPSMLIYLDNVINRVGEANENYAREILELFAFGVDNRYTQADIEELSRCFTGWQVRKVKLDQVQSFPGSAINPPIEPSAGFFDFPMIELGPGWRYFKGTREPVQYREGVAPEWTTIEFDDTGWLEGATGIGYGDDDDATVVDDMQRRYTSLYLRRNFVLPANTDISKLVLSIDYDDGFVAYINGREIGRSASMVDAGQPPRYNETTSQGHEAGGDPDEISLARYERFFNAFPEPNILSIQGHNVNLTSSDFSVLPRLVVRSVTQESIENGDPNGAWAFRFNPGDHDYSAKILFEGTEREMRIPDDRVGIEGLDDALDLVHMMANHPSSREFICVKLVNKFVGDQITLRTYKDGSAPSHLIMTVDRAIEAWQTAKPVGHIGTVLASIFDRSDQTNPFWTQSVYHAKVKTPIEYINSLGRAMEWPLRLDDLPEINEAMGMHFFTRDEPNGWSEYGFDWVNTGAMLERLDFATALTRHSGNQYMRSWSIGRYLRQHDLETEEEILNHFNQLLFNGSLPKDTRDLILNFARTVENGRRIVLSPERSDYLPRVGELIGLILAIPEMHYQ